MAERTDGVGRHGREEMSWIHSAAGQRAGQNTGGQNSVAKTAPAAIQRETARPHGILRLARALNTVGWSDPGSSTGDAFDIMAIPDRAKAESVRDRTGYARKLGFDIKTRLFPAYTRSHGNPFAEIRGAIGSPSERPNGITRRLMPSDLPEFSGRSRSLQWAG